MSKCHFCNTETKTINAPHWAGDEWLRIEVCTDTTCRDSIARTPRAPRKPKAEPQLAGEWAMVGAMLTGKTYEEMK